MKTIVLGAQGFLGTYFASALGGNAILHINSPNQEMFDSHFSLHLTPESSEKLAEIIGEYRPDYIINCVGATNIDFCESNPDSSFFLNEQIPLRLAELSETFGYKLVHISTDAVFSGQQSYSSEEDLCTPTTVYGRSKLAGERAVSMISPNSLICRVNFVGANPRGVSLFDYFYQNMKKNIPVTGFTNIHFTPLAVDETVKIIFDLISRHEKGIYHVVGTDRISKYEFAEIIRNIWNLDESLLKPGIYDSKVRRSMDLSLDNSKLRELGIIPTPIEESLRDLASIV